jgi:hypothetical protein
MYSNDEHTEVKVERDKGKKLKKIVIVLFFLGIIIGVTVWTVKVVSEIKSMYNELNINHDGLWFPNDDKG